MHEAAPQSAAPESARERADYPRLGEGTRRRYRGLPRGAWRDSYHVLLTMSWPGFFAVTAGAFLFINICFGFLYWLNPGGLSGVRPGSFQDAFFFSVQTVGTLGYGVMAPRSLYANVVVTIEVFIGLFELAAATGLLFARISRPTARIMFSNWAVITPFEGVPTFIFRAANQRRNLVVEAEVSLTLVRDVTTAEGDIVRRFEELRTLRAKSPLFFLTWQIMHPIDAASPLLGETRESLLAQRAEVLAILKGTDETFASTIHARASYFPDEIAWGRRLADVFLYDEAGRRIIDFSRFHELAES
ncbi:MAG TPA: ion channel [Caulobacteraceae bacterium]|nr:ion channel [Caulobacteraceae bacterium]